MQVFTLSIKDVSFLVETGGKFHRASWKRVSTTIEPRFTFITNDSNRLHAWNITYEDWQGYPPPVISSMAEPLKALVGSGPFIFDYWDTTAGIIHLVRNPDYWVDGRVKANVLAASQRIAPGDPLTFHMQLLNACMLIRFSGSLTMRL
jgi:ABC-type transport system substrate-binding protein